ncbi:HAD family hydrolase [Nonomuraea sediminis]|uniref:HAD family hydrolase n=1 Tax=Nonomuraea sediminis TaxID=2835864 RepID=UPI001BDDAB0B|nr:HAD family hydrolase [Nonomuraea sediminis]
MQRLALFDLDNTLIDLDAAFAVWAREFAEEHGLGRKGKEWLISLDQNGVPHRELFFTKVRDRFKLSAPAPRLWSEYRARMPHLVTCRPEVIAALSSLRLEGWRVGIITNGTPDNQLGKISETGLIDVVDGYALSGAEGIRKPDRQLFNIAAHRCGASLGDGGWMVGDNLEADIKGGCMAGLRTIWINRRSGTSPALADHVVTDVLEGIALLRT